MRLELEKRPHRDEEQQHQHQHQQQQQQQHQETHHHQSHHQPRLQMSSTMESSGDCLSGGFTSLNYDSQDGTSTRNDGLDLYAMRDDCYPGDDCLGDSSQNQQRKLHTEFGQAFQHYGSQGSSLGFQQNPYADYQNYQNIPSTSRSPFQQQFQQVTSNPGFSHYGSYSQSTNSNSASINNCHQAHSLMQQTQQQHNSIIYDTPFAQEEMTGSQYTNLNSIQPMNSVVQQIGKLEPFSELLSNRYSYYGDIVDQQQHQQQNQQQQPQQQQQHHGAYGATKVDMEKNEMGVREQTDQLSEEDCDENFGEIIKKSMVETVSA